MAVLIISGAILGGVIFQDFTFALLGAFLGFVVGRMNHLSQQIDQLKRTVHRLKLQRITPHQANSDLVKTEQPVSGQPKSEQADPEFQVKQAQETRQDASFADETPEIEYATHSTAKSSSEEIKITAAAEDLGVRSEAVNQNVADHKPTQTNRSQANQKQQSDFIMKIANFVIDYFTHGNIVVRVGAVILFFGVAFL